MYEIVCETSSTPHFAPFASIGVNASPVFGQVSEICPPPSSTIYKHHHLKLSDKKDGS
jgi:hypothetical protein